MTEPYDSTLIDCLWAIWQKNPPTPDPKGDRIFARFTESGGDEPGWQDFVLVALVRPRRHRRTAGESALEVQWVDGAPPIDAVEDAVKAGELTGVFMAGFLRLQWVRSSGDGPPEDRVMDWASPKRE